MNAVRLRPCAGPGCGKQISALNRPMCRACWSRVPTELRDAVRRARGADPANERTFRYRSALHAAQASIAPEPGHLNPADVASCRGKVRFATETAAALRAEEIRARSGDQMGAYRCTACAWIHLGHRGGATGHRHTPGSGAGGRLAKRAQIRP